MELGTIYYKSDDDFYEGIAALVKKGLTFHADYDKLRITLTGGF